MFSSPRRLLSDTRMRDPPLTVLLDSSAILALLDRGDRDHDSARDMLTQLHAGRASLFCTNFIRAEAYTLVGVRLSWQMAGQWLRSLDVPVERITASDEERAILILLSHQDKGYSFVDATSFAVMERLSLREAFTFDRHFQQFGFRTLPQES